MSSYPWPFFLRFHAVYLAQRPAVHNLQHLARMCVRLRLGPPETPDIFRISAVIVRVRLGPREIGETGRVLAVGQFPPGDADTGVIDLEPSGGVLCGLPSWGVSVGP